jgi:hypothetical protein
MARRQKRMAGPNRLIVSPNLSEYFRKEVVEARDSLGLKLSELAEYYLVNLLCEFSRKDTAPVTTNEPLALLYKKALDSSVAERVQLLKNLGDVALYIAGFFAEFIERSLVDLNYYIAMGGNAYGNVSEIVGSRPQGETHAELFEQLSRRFTELVDLLNEVADRSREAGDTSTEVLRLYDRWVKTKSQRIQKLLVERGLMPHSPKLKDTYH